jgi:hypothetical protein
MSGLSIGESGFMRDPAVILQTYSVVVFGCGIISPGLEMKRGFACRRRTMRRR